VNRLIVSNLHYEITEADLVKIFQPYGEFSRKPTIRYDRSGRSTGFAYVNYVNEEDALLAKRELHGVLAKGEPINIVVESFVTRNPSKRVEENKGRGFTGANNHLSLKDRLAKTSLIHRFSDAAPAAAATTKDVEMVDESHTPGPVRTPRGAARRAVSDRAPRRGGGAGGAAAASTRAARAKPKTADDLDKELDAYVHDGAKEVVVADVAMAA